MNSFVTRISKFFRWVGATFAAFLIRACHEVAHGAGIGRRLWGFAKITAIVLAIIGTGGLLGAASGVIPIKASSGHWPITEWFLQTSMSRSVATHSVGIEAPPLEDPRLVLQGAGHYETACRWCHGSPTLHHPRVAAAMTPHPPYLPPGIHKWEPEELFYIVKHGVKFTGMPAWPAAHRDDEVWAMTAFLLKFPSLDAEGYRALVFNEHDTHAEDVTASEDVPIHRQSASQQARRIIQDRCARCHGHDGLGRGLGAFPKLAGQQEHYLRLALEAYATGDRPSGVMEPIAAALEPEEINLLAGYFSALRPETKDDTTHASSSAVGDHVESQRREAIERGRIIAEQGLARLRIPACSGCHGSSQEHLNPAYPSLEGQDAPYLVTQLKLFKSGYRGGSKHAHLMNHVAPRLNSQQIEDVAAYYESRPLKLK